MNAYARLMRLDKPIGIILLWAPTAWALWLAQPRSPAMKWVVYFFLGTFVMRAAGCIINDLADRNFDKHVLRTRLRPITHGEISIAQALVLLGILLSVALLILLQLPKLCWLEGVVGLIITVLYPFCKRFFHAPQLILGIAFSMGIPMAFAATHTPVNLTLLLLWVINFLWIVAYDTQYAMLDKEYDLRLGIHSTAILFGKNLFFILLGLQATFHGLWLVLDAHLTFSLRFDFLWLLGLAVLVYQNYLIKLHQPEAFMQAFLSNGVYGLIMWLAVIVR